MAIFSLLGFLNIRLHRQELEAATLTSAERVSDVIRRSTRYYMLRNDRDGLHDFMQTVGGEPGIVKLRIFDQSGQITVSTDAAEVSHSVDQRAEACYGCHAQSQPLTRLNRPDRFRIYRMDGKRVLGIITPIENQMECSNASCHAHPASQKVLGVLDANLSLVKADTQLAAGTRDMAFYTILAMIAVAILSWLFVWRVVGSPIAELEDGTERLSKGELGYQLDVKAKDEIGDLAQSFNDMSLQLQAANQEIVAWNRTLEERVEHKTRELKRAHDHVLHVEKMASIGKLAAIVAHEVNNPLSGILTYAKLIKKWVERGETNTEPKHGEAIQCLELIAGESRRCGELIKNLLTFSRTAPINLQPTDIVEVIRRALMLVQHQLEMSGVQVQTDFAAGLPLLQCDPAQIEQVLLALIMNAVDAMPKGGNLWITSRLAEDDELQIEVRDDGSGIPRDILSQIFEPFLTTKEVGKGVGLGLAISRGIMERHGGKIEVQSEVGEGTTFTLTLPRESRAAAWVETANSAAAV
ncbi:MAG: HAMP domain-containing protein [Acidobacteriales bacterium]|nr:HAMP domain-containing protein [Terriglobales bacterium]